MLRYTNHFRTIPAGKCALIGASNVNKRLQYRWIETPPEFDGSGAYGELLNNTYNNYLSGNEDRYMQSWYLSSLILSKLDRK